MAIVSLDWNALVTERDALRAEVERMHAVVEAARKFIAVAFDYSDQERWWAGHNALAAALDAAKEGE